MGMVEKERLNTRHIWVPSYMQVLQGAYRSPMHHSPSQTITEKCPPSHIVWEHPYIYTLNIYTHKQKLQNRAESYPV